MTPDELVNGALTVHSSSLVLSLAAVYAVFGDKFIKPLIERAEGTCARLRTKLSKELIAALQPFAPSDNPPSVATVQGLYGADGQPLSTAVIRNATSLGSEAFNDAVRGFLDGESDDFKNYWTAVKLTRSIIDHWNFIRLVVGIWPIAALCAAGLFGCFSKALIQTPSPEWLWTFAAMPIIPLILAGVRLPWLAYSANVLEKLEE